MRNVLITIVVLTAVLVGGYGVYVTTKDKTEVSDGKPKEESTEQKGSKDNLEPSSNLVNSIDKFINNWVEENGEELQTLILDNFDSITGNYVYAAEIVSQGKETVVNTGLSEITLASNKVATFKDLTDSVYKPKDGDKGVAIVKYTNGKVTSLDFHRIQSGSFGQIQKAILKSKVNLTKDEEEKDEDGKTVDDYSETSVQDWKGMALLTAREILKSDMAPIFMVPYFDLKLERDFKETYYYVVAGSLVSSRKDQTVLEASNGKKIVIDFGLTGQDAHYGIPVWMHVIVNEGKVENIEMQPFEGANLKEMSDGVMAYITTSVLDRKVSIWGLENGHSERAKTIQKMQ